MKQGCHQRPGAGDFPWLLSWEAWRKIEPKVIPACVTAVQLPTYYYWMNLQTWNLSYSPDEKKKHVLLEHLVAISEYYLIWVTYRASSMFKRSFLHPFFRSASILYPILSQLTRYVNSTWTVILRYFVLGWIMFFSLKYIKYQEFDKPLVIVQVRFVQKEIITFSLWFFMTVITAN